MSRSRTHRYFLEGRRGAYKVVGDEILVLAGDLDLVVDRGNVEIKGLYNN